jgi:hypothetical protein
MEKKDGSRSGNLSSKGFKQINRNILIFLFFLLLSFIFWYLNSLSKEIDTALRYPVTYTNFPGGDSSSGNLPPKLDLMLKGHGYSILRLKLTGNRNPVVIDFSEINFTKITEEDDKKSYIIMAPLITTFNSQLMSECKITSVKPDTLFFSLK